MPRCVFKLVCDTIEARKELFAYAKNMSTNGDHYWVFAHVTQLLAEERHHADWHAGMDAAGKLLLDLTASKNMEYEEFIFSV